ncbi:MAG: hypothetical protein JW699_00645 [Chitinispirillaceae bacterium]|nr:hypothetical protein [Chitinispirillaceae bacterium]
MKRKFKYSSIINIVQESGFGKKNAEKERRKNSGAFGSAGGVVRGRKRGRMTGPRGFRAAIASGYSYISVYNSFRYFGIFLKKPGALSGNGLYIIY